MLWVLHGHFGMATESRKKQRNSDVAEQESVGPALSIAQSAISSFRAVEMDWMPLVRAFRCQCQRVVVQQQEKAEKQ